MNNNLAGQLDHNILAVQPDNMPIIVHSHLRWTDVWQRPQQVLSRLARHHPVLFIEEPHWQEALPESRLEVTRPLPNIWRAVPTLKIDPEMTVAKRCAIVRRMLGETGLLAVTFAAPVQWFYSPLTAPHMLGHINAKCVVYDCMDELANFKNAPTALREAECCLLKTADLVFTGGYQLFEAKSRLHKNVHFYGCGVDVGHFGRARLAETALPAEVAALPRPVFGYFGVIDERLDYELMAKLADAFPQASIVMAGPLAKVERKDLPQRPNIYWLGAQPYENLPALVKAFDVCLMPFALNEATRYINPTKTLEYMAAGKPIVSTAVPDVIHNFTPVVAVAHSHSAFIRAVQNACVAPDAALIGRGVEKAGRQTWEVIVSAMRGHVLQCLECASH